MTNLSIILVNPQMGENIGAAARVMHNFAIDDLRIVSPRDGWPNEKAVTMSAGGKHIVNDAVVYENLADSMEDVEVAFAISARKRDMVKDVFSPEEAISKLFDSKNENAKNNIKKVAFVFGPENSGLTNKDISLCNSIVTIPVNPEYPSLNLAQAVSLLCYEYSKFNCDNSNMCNQADIKIAGKKDIAYFVDELVKNLDDRDFYKSEDMKPTMIVNLTNIFSRNELTQQELNSLMGIIKCLSK